MVNIKLIPHDGLDIQNIGKVYFGQTPNEVEKILGVPDVTHLSYCHNGITYFYNFAYKENLKSGVTLTNNMQYFYNDYEIKIMFDADKKVEFIECNAGHFSDKAKTLIFDTDFFNLPADEAIELLTKKNDGSVFNENPGRPKKSLFYLELDVGIWRDMDETDIEEIVNEAIIAGVYEINKECIGRDSQAARYFQSVSIGKKGYFDYYVHSL